MLYIYEMKNNTKPLREVDMKLIKKHLEAKTIRFSNRMFYPLVFAN